MKLIAGVDIGNSTTEVCIGRIKDDSSLEFLSSSMVFTTGAKGTAENVKGIIRGIEEAVSKVNLKVSDIDIIRINEAAPVIGDTAMETITETIITESTMIGHNPKTPGGFGIGKGITLHFDHIEKAEANKQYILVIPEYIPFDVAAPAINNALKKGVQINGAIVQSDEAVLISNRINKTIPIVDEVKYIDKVPLGMPCILEVADTGKTIQTLSNPYGIASMFNLTPEQTKYVVPIAKSLIGNRSAVVIKTPSGEVKERVIPAGKLYIKSQKHIETIDIDSGAEEIMNLLSKIDNIEDIEGESGTNIGGMLSNVKSNMAYLTGEAIENIKIKDILAIDTVIPLKVRGGIAEETAMENAVAIAAMVKTDRLPMKKIAEKLQAETGVYVEIAGVEAVMAALGALTTPGTKLPIAILDMGGGSTDAALLDEKGTVKSIHLAGAGELVTMIINSEMGLSNRTIAEEIKKHPLAKVESLYQIRVENGYTKFFDEPLRPELYGRVVILKGEEMIPILNDMSMEKIVEIRKVAKKKVFVQNALRALSIIAPMNNIRNIPNIVLVGGSALDFEIPELVMEELSKYKIVCGRGNIRKVEGPRNAVATGLVISYL
ncbi:diol dehydratase reactivase subunit alpha [Clostridium sp. SYSU_GA19001]|uniref:diol dehydratase reactivase subunit alpha n=1 Tax=Clostridium caldaquaticum TaxID=2940653 RepID=UPI00207766A1|nr:diol dehydratase reactivase subunit alpha [Clostridium caldaquaticum]